MPYEKKSKFILEPFPASVETGGGGALEDKIIPSSPDGPGSQHDQLHEKRFLQSKFEASQHAVNIRLLWWCPRGTKVLPTHVRKRAVEE
jgi:hypothetical protein